MLRLHQHTPGTLVALAEYLYQRTNGMIGSLSQLVRGAAILAIQDGTDQITRDLLDLVPVDYAAERAHRARPQATPQRPQRRLVAFRGRADTTRTCTRRLPRR